MEHIPKGKPSHVKLDKDFVGQYPVQSEAKQSKKDNNTTSWKVDSTEEAGFLLQETELKILQRQIKSNYRRTCHLTEKSNFTKA